MVTNARKSERVFASSESRFCGGTNRRFGVLLCDDAQPVARRYRGVVKRLRSFFSTYGLDALIALLALAAAAGTLGPDGQLPARRPPARVWRSRPSW